MNINFIARREFANIARRHHIGEEEVEQRLQAIIIKNINNPDKTIREEWEKIPHEGKVPTPEELFDYMVAGYGSWNELSSIWISASLGTMISDEYE